MKLTKLLAVAAISTMCAVSANAATVNITGVTGLWTDVDPNNVVGITGLNTSSISWGTSTGSGQSGYDFSGNSPQGDVSSPFTVGTFTHRNFPIAGSPTPPSITGATLEVTVLGDVVDVGGTVAFNLGSTFVFSHNETSNSSSSCPGQTVPCDDIVTLLSSAFTGDSLTLDGIDYVFDLVGFVLGGGNPFTSFATTEGQSNSANLLGAFVTRGSVEPVPLPAAGFLLLGALGALGFFKRFGRATG